MELHSVVASFFGEADGDLMLIARAYMTAPGLWLRNLDARYLVSRELRCMPRQHRTTVT